MAVTPLHCLFLLSLALIFSSPPVIADDLIVDTCKKTLHNDLCLSILRSDPSSQKADLKGLLAIALKAANKSAADAVEHIATLKGETTDYYVEQRLSACSEHYQDAMDQIDDSEEALDSNGYSDFNTWVTAAMSDAESCEDEFNDEPGHPSPLTLQNDDFNKICGITLAIAKLLS
ncbi:hypothetical protein MRB53_010628 [Persea americana]|uniref:Uncharacterized protein n=1 Tax=Persea americana TaxID=3435 RepID=A0ACC2LSK9_PERAE|nr:hypothetical protein MRB53_010628 [Persea americana]